MVRTDDTRCEVAEQDIHRSWPKFYRPARRGYLGSTWMEPLSDQAPKRHTDHSRSGRPKIQRAQNRSAPSRSGSHVPGDQRLSPEFATGEDVDGQRPQVQRPRSRPWWSCQRHLLRLLLQFSASSVYDRPRSPTDRSPQNSQARVSRKANFQQRPSTRCARGNQSDSLSIVLVSFFLSKHV